MTNQVIVVRFAFTNPRPWQAAMELIRRGYPIVDRKRHLLWEWICISTVK